MDAVTIHKLRAALQLAEGGDLRGANRMLDVGPAYTAASRACEDANGVGWVGAWEDYQRDRDPDPLIDALREALRQGDPV